MVPEAHLHTKPEDVVKGALAAGMSAIAIVDHNTGRGIEGIRQAARRSGLVILPGVEITSRGGHCLGIFEPDTSVAVIQGLVRALGFHEKDEGDGFVQAECWIDEVFQEIAQRGGLAVAAHIDRHPRGFIASQEALSDKVRIHNSPYLSALEITAPADKKLWNEGLVTYFPKKYACVLGSDGHAPAEIGRRCVYMNIPKVTLEGLLLAFREHPHRLKFPHELEEEETSPPLP